MLCQSYPQCNLIADMLTLNILAQDSLDIWRIAWFFEMLLFFHFQSDHDKINTFLVFWGWYMVLAEAWTLPFLPHSSVSYVAPQTDFLTIFK